MRASRQADRPADRQIPHTGVRISSSISRRPPATTGGAVRAIAATLGPDFGLTLAFLGTLATLVAAYGASFVWAKGPILVAGGILVSLVGIALAYRLPGILRGAPERMFGATLRMAQHSSRAATEERMPSMPCRAIKASTPARSGVNAAILAP